MPGLLCLGLHITKCAGTSLITTLRRTLLEDEYYFFSSYHEVWLASRPVFSDIVARERLRIVFGHYCHETLLSVFADRPIFLFTGLREPVACAISGYRHMNAVRAQAGRDPLSAEAYLQDHANAICAEILRCFPSLADGPGATWQKARSALSLCDYIYATERFETDVKALLDVLDVVPHAVARDNVSDMRRPDAGAAAFVASEIGKIRDHDHEFLGEDMRLWEAMQQYLGRPWLRRRALGGARWALDRAAFAAGLPPPEVALRVFCARERDFMAQEFEELGRVSALRAALAARIAVARATLERLGGEAA